MEARVQLVKEHYVVLSLAKAGNAVAFAARRDLNTLAAAAEPRSFEEGQVGGWGWAWVWLLLRHCSALLW